MVSLGRRYYCHGLIFSCFTKNTYITLMKPTGIIFDLDGVLVDSTERFKRIDLDAFQNKDKDKFVASLKAYSADCKGDKVILSCAQLLSSLCAFYHPEKIFFVTARQDIGYSPTMQWLKENDIFGPDTFDNELIMNPQSLDDFTFEDFDHAAWKGQVASDLSKNYNILLAVDDTEANCLAFASRGITTLQFLKPGLGKLVI